MGGKVFIKKKKENMLGPQSRFFAVSAVNGPPRGDAAAIAPPGFRPVLTYFTGPSPAPGPVQFDAQGAWKPVNALEAPPVAAAVPVVSPETVALALQSVGDTKPPRTLT